MTHAEASDAAQKIGEAYSDVGKDWENARTAEQRVRLAVEEQLREMVPAAATVAAVNGVQGTGDSKVVAVHENRFFEITVGDFAEGREPVLTTLRMRNIDPLNASVESDMTFSGHRADGRLVVRETLWRFRIGDLHLEFGTYVDHHRSWIESDERFALALAEAIGWQPPGSTVPLARVT